MIERDCELSFEMALERGPLWHVCTPGENVELICEDADDYRFCLSNIAISAAESGMTVYIDEIMGTHIHVLLGGSREGCFQFIDCYRYRLRKYLEEKGRVVPLNGFRCDNPIPITNLDMARKEVCYIARNGYLANSSYTPFSYPWGSAVLLFNPLPASVQGIPYSQVPHRTRRKLERKRLLVPPERYRYADGVILPSSYSEYKVVESFFRDAHHYYSMVSKNWEAFSECAKRLGDNVVLTYEELLSAARMIAKRDYNVKQLSLLAPPQKIALAKVLHFDYKATNTQLRAILKMPTTELEALFPKR